MPRKHHAPSGRHPRSRRLRRPPTDRPSRNINNNDNKNKNSISFLRRVGMNYPLSKPSLPQRCPRTRRWILATTLRRAAAAAVCAVFLKNRPPHGIFLGRVVVAPRTYPCREILRELMMMMTTMPIRPCMCWTTILASRRRSSLAMMIMSTTAATPVTTALNGTRSLRCVTKAAAVATARWCGLPTKWKALRSPRFTNLRAGVGINDSNMQYEVHIPTNHALYYTALHYYTFFYVLFPSDHRDAGRSSRKLPTLFHFTPLRICTARHKLMSSILTVNYIFFLEVKYCCNAIKGKSVPL